MPLLAVVGAHLAGQPLNHELTDRAATFVEVTRTEPCYRMFRLEGEPARPGLVRFAPGGPGVGSVEVEVWSLDDASFGSFVAQVRAPLCIGTVLIEGGRSVIGFLCESIDAVAGVDITSSGGWRAFLDRHQPPGIS